MQVDTHHWYYMVNRAQPWAMSCLWGITAVGTSYTVVLLGSETNQFNGLFNGAGALGSAACTHSCIVAADALLVVQLGASVVVSSNVLFLAC